MAETAILVSTIMQTTGYSVPVKSIEGAENIQLNVDADKKETTKWLIEAAHNIVLDTILNLPSGTAAMIFIKSTGIFTITFPSANGFVVVNINETDNLPAAGLYAIYDIERIGSEYLVTRRK